jgi:hypothetical protein
VSIALLLITAAQARDLGQWEGSSFSAWYAELMQPDHPTVSCCGEADAYWADDFEQKGDHYVAVITDDRDDGPLRRPHVDIGTRVEIPEYKLKVDQGNPTGHGIVFMSPTKHVYCYLPPAGL